MKFTPDELLTIQRTAHTVWNEIGYDVLTAVADPQLNDHPKDSIPRSHVIELVLDAGRLTDRISDGDLRTKIDAAPYGQLQRILRKSFTYARYGM